MLKLKQFLEAIEYRITDGSDFCWDCYGNNAYNLDSFGGWTGNDASPSGTVIFDRVTQEVYAIEAVDSTNNRAYRLINPSFKAAHDAEAERRGVSGTQCYDDVEYIDLSVDEDMLEKLTAIMRGDDYDTRIMITLELTDEENQQLLLMAEEQSMTVDEFVEHILAKHITFMKLSENHDDKN